MYLSILFMVSSLALGQSNDCPSASELTLKGMEKIEKCQTIVRSQIESYS